MKLKVMLAVVLTAAMGVAGCGGGGSNEQSEAEDQGLAFVTAWSNSDASGACDLLSPKAMNTFDFDTGPFSCEAWILRGHKDVRLPEVTNASVSGDEATVEVTVSGGEVATIDLVEGTDGEWQVDNYQFNGEKLR